MPQDHPVGTRVARLLVRAGAAATHKCTTSLLPTHPSAGSRLPRSPR